MNICLLQLATFLITLARPALAAKAPPEFALQDHLPYVAQWGEYRVTVVADGAMKQRFQILDQRGKVMVEITALSIESVDYPDLSGRRAGEEVRVVTWPGNNTLSNIRTYCFTRRGGLRNILEKQGWFDRLVDLDGDGTPELLVDDGTPLEWVASLCHACCPSIMLVLRWDGREYRVANQALPSPARHKATEYRKDLSAILKHWNDEKPPGERSRDQFQTAALGYWANMATIGKAEPAKRWLKRNLAAWQWEEVNADLPEVQQRLTLIPSQTRLNRHQSIQAPSIMDKE